MTASVVLFEVDTIGVSIPELKGYAPGAADGHSMAASLLSLQGVQVPPRQVQLPRVGGGIDRIKADQTALMVLVANAGRGAGFE